MNMYEPYGIRFGDLVSFGFIRYQSLTLLSDARELSQVLRQMHEEKSRHQAMAQGRGSDCTT
jgi:hypothetical protein